MIIGIIGRKRSGKDTLANEIVTQKALQGLAPCRLSFAEGIRDICQKYLKITSKELTADHLKDIPLIRDGEVVRLLHPLNGQSFLTPRLAMQAIGEWLRKIYPNVWVDQTIIAAQAWHTRHCCDMWDPRTLVLITDVRHHNEAEAIQACGGFLVKKGSRPPRADDLAALHESEIHVDDLPFDLEIPWMEELSVDDLQREVHNLLTKVTEKGERHRHTR